MPGLGTLAALICRDHLHIAGPNIQRLAETAGAIGWRSGQRMIERAAIGVGTTALAVDAGTGVELTALIESAAGTYFSAELARQAVTLPRHAVVGSYPVGGLAAEEHIEFLADAPVIFAGNSLISITPSSVMALIPVTNEAVSLPAFAAFAESEGRKAIFRGLDRIFASRLAPSSASSFAGTSSVSTDLDTLIGDLIVANGQRAILAGSLGVVRKLAFLTIEGVEAFPMVNAITPGEIKGIPLFPSDQFAEGRLLAVDPSGVACTIDEIQVEASKSAALNLNSIPEMPANLVSMFQNSSICLRISAAFTCTPLRDANVTAEIDGIAWTAA
jgi:hypothetical protein